MDATEARPGPTVVGALPVAPPRCGMGGSSLADHDRALACRCARLARDAGGPGSSREGSPAWSWPAGCSGPPAAGDRRLPRCRRTRRPHRLRPPGVRFCRARPSIRPVEGGTESDLAVIAAELLSARTECGSDQACLEQRRRDRRCSAARRRRRSGSRGSHRDAARRIRRSRRPAGGGVPAQLRRRSSSSSCAPTTGGCSATSTTSRSSEPPIRFRAGPRTTRPRGASSPS